MIGPADTNHGKATATSAEFDRRAGREVESNPSASTTSTYDGMADFAGPVGVPSERGAAVCEAIDNGRSNLEAQPDDGCAEVVPIRPASPSERRRVCDVVLEEENGQRYVIVQLQGLEEPLVLSASEPAMLVDLLGRGERWIRETPQRAHALVRATLLGREVALLARDDGRRVLSLEMLLAELATEATPKAAAYDGRCACGAKTMIGEKIGWHATIERVVACVGCRPQLKDARVSRPDPGRRPSIYCDAVTPEVVLKVWENLIARMTANGATIYLFGGDPELTRGTTAYISHATGAPLIDIVGDLPGMAGIVRRSVRIEKFKGKELVEVDAPKGLLEDLVRFPNPSLPRLKAIARVPVVLRDGRVLTEQGYDSTSGIYLAPNIKVPKVPDAPSEGDLARARALLLDELLVDFPLLKEQGAHAGALACLFVPFARDLFEGPSPLFVFTAPVSRTGKSLLATLIQIVATGNSRTTRLPKSDDQINHKITTLLRRAPAVVVFDNVRDAVESESLEALLTSQVYQDRLLRTNDEVALPNRTNWILTSNNAKLGRDIVGRTVTINLRAKEERPGERTGFKQPQIAAWVRDHGPELVWAVLVAIKPWIVAGRPKDEAVVLGGFEEWAAAIGGIVKHLGVGGLSVAIRASRERDAEAEDGGDFLCAWRDKHGTDAVKPIRLYEIAVDAGLYEKQLSGVRDPGWKGRRMVEILERLMLVTEHDLGDAGPWRIVPTEKKVHGSGAYHLQPQGWTYAPAPPPGPAPLPPDVLL